MAETLNDLRVMTKESQVFQAHMLQNIATHFATLFQIIGSIANSYPIEARRRQKARDKAGHIFDDCGEDFTPPLLAQSEDDDECKKSEDELQEDESGNFIGYC